MNQDYKPGILTIITHYIAFFMAMNFYFLISILPALVWWAMFEPGLLDVIPLAIMGPGLTAMLCCMIKFRETNFEKEDLPTAKDFWRFYRQNVLDTLKLWLPYVMLMVILSTNVMHYAGGQVTRLIFTVSGIAGMVLFTLCIINVLMINAKFSFRVRDLYRLGMFYLFKDVKATVSYGVVCFLMVVVALLVSEILLFLVASILGYLMVHYGQAVLRDIGQTFVATHETEN